MFRRLPYFAAACGPPPPITGYFANWKKFDPRKLRPVSTELCNAPVAVMTLMTEKTPMVIPSIVRPERSLFAPSAVNARRSTSMKGINYS